MSFEELLVNQRRISELGRMMKLIRWDKTSCVSFSRSGYERGESPGIFHFLGFTFYWGHTRKGAASPKVKTHGKRIRSTLRNVNEWARQIRNKYKLTHIWKLFCSKLEGHVRYFGASFNLKRVGIFVHKAVKIMFKWLNRRRQRKSFEWVKFRFFIAANPLPIIKVHHSLF